MEAESKSHLTLGEFLQQTREKKNLTVEHVAEQLKLKLSTVKALEANLYEEVGGMVYVKGYLKNYAKLLNVNIDSALAEIEGPAETHYPLEVQVTKKVINNNKPLHFKLKKDQLGLWACGMVLILLVVLAFAWHRHRTHEKLAREQVAVLTVPAKDIELPKISISTIEAPKEHDRPKAEEKHHAVEPAKKADEMLPPPVLEDKNRTNEE